MRRLWTGVLPLVLLASSVHAACPPPGHDAATLQALKASDFALPDVRAREGLAVALLDCLADPDPALRDGIAYEALSSWMRGQQLSRPTLVRLRDGLLARLEADEPQGFGPPFAALVLSELARTDRILPWMAEEERARVVDAAARYLGGVRDYRGFIDGQGWRHGVAHGADIVLQLALNPALDDVQRERLRDAVAVQIAPADGHAYVHGESMRLARATLFLARADTHDAATWRGWLKQVADPAPLPDWNAAFSSEAGLARRHNVTAFLTALYLLANEQDDAATRERLLPGLRAVLETMP